jgi:hypothetical protein
VLNDFQDFSMVHVSWGVQSLAFSLGLKDLRSVANFRLYFRVPELSAFILLYFC